MNEYISRIKEQMRRRRVQKRFEAIFIERINFFFVHYVVPQINGVTVFNSKKFEFSYGKAHLSTILETCRAYIQKYRNQKKLNNNNKSREGLLLLLLLLRFIIIITITIFYLKKKRKREETSKSAFSIFGNIYRQFIYNSTVGIFRGLS